MKRRTFLKTAAALVTGTAATQTIHVSRGIGIAECIFIVVILVIAGYVIFKIIRWCRTYLGDPTNLPPGTVSNVVNRGDVSVLPPLIGGAHGTNSIAFQSSSDLKEWNSEYELHISATATTVTATVTRPGYATISKSAEIIDPGTGPQSTIDMRNETMGQFPLPKGNYFRLLSAE